MPDRDCDVALDIYLPTISGRPLSEALAVGHCFGDDVAEYAPVDEARRRVAEHLRASAGVERLEDGGFVLRVHGGRRALERTLACRPRLATRSQRARP